MKIIASFFIISAATLLAGNASAESAELHKAAATDKSGQEVQRLLENGAKVNEKDKNGMTPLHWATTNANYKAIGILLEFGAAVNVKSARGGWTPLHFALAGGSPYALVPDTEGDGGILKLLLDNGANPNAKDDDGETPVDLLNRLHRRMLNLLKPKR